MKAEMIHKIEDYLLGDVSYTELESYASSAGVADLDEKIEWVKNAGIAIEADGLRNQIKQLLSKEEGAVAPKRKARVISMKPARWIMGIAASALILIAGYWAFFSLSGLNDTYAAYEYVDPGLPVVMSHSDNYELYDALSYYSEENYKVTIEKLTDLQSNNISSDTISFYLGASQLYEGDPKSASVELQKIFIYPASIFQKRAEWLLIMCALRQDNIEAARSQIITLISNTDHPFYVKALALKEELEKQ